MTKPRRALGVYQDGPFHLVRSEGQLRLAPDPVDAPFLRFVTEVAGAFDSLVVFARVVDGEPTDDRVLLPAGTGFVRLPDYGRLTRLHAVARAALGTISAFWRGLDSVDTVWAFGPHPFQFVLVALARLRGKRVVLGVRQDTPAYFRARLPSARWKPIVAGIDAMDLVHRLIARRVPATVVGRANAERFRGRRVLAMAPSLVPAAEVVSEARVLDWSGEVRLLTVGRIDTEKNPSLVADTLAALERERPGRYRLSWVGVGPHAEGLRRRAAQLGIGDRLELPGYVPFGPALLALYRNAHLFVHVSLTEGVPQVLHEALASAAPVVATDVGGVRDALDDGRAGLLVPPNDLDALVAAVLRLSEDSELRSALVARGLVLARARTLEAEAARVAAFLGG